MIDKILDAKSTLETVLLEMVNGGVSTKYVEIIAGVINKLNTVVDKMTEE